MMGCGCLIHVGRPHRLSERLWGMQVYLPLSAVLGRPEIDSEELDFRRMCLRHLDSAARRDLSLELR
jgi:hypothetical protein